MCCSGRECGCMGQPIDPVVCSGECFDALLNKNKPVQAFKIVGQTTATVRDTEAVEKQLAELDQTDSDKLSIDALLSEFKRQGFDASGWDGEEGAEKAIVDGVVNHINERLENRVGEIKIEILRRVLLIKSEPDGIVRETMIDEMYLYL